MSRSTWTPRVAATIGVLTTAALLGGLTPGRADADTTYTGCLNSGGSITRVAIGTSPRGSCSPNETQISWNATGPAGPAGPTGATGAAGPAGPAGVLGFYKVTASYHCPDAPPGSCTIVPPIAQCIGKDVATGGAAYRTVSDPSVPLQQFVAVPFPTVDFTSNPPTGFTTTPQGIGSGDTVYVVAICANLP